MESPKGPKPRVFSVEFKEGAARRLLAGESATALSRELASSAPCCIAGATPIAAREWAG